MNNNASGPKICPECDHVFQGNDWDGIDAHWKAKHGHIMPYEEAWPHKWNLQKKNGRIGKYDQSRTPWWRMTQLARRLTGDTRVVGQAALRTGVEQYPRTRVTLQQATRVILKSPD